MGPRRRLRRIRAMPQAILLMVAGVAALTREAHPNWSVEQIKAAIVNTGDPAKVALLEELLV